MEKSSIRVLLADDHPLVMMGFAMALADFGIEVVAQALTPDVAIQKYATFLPDVLVLDIRFGEKLCGLDVAKNVLKGFPDAKIVFLSQFDQEGLIKESYRLGGRAFVTKNCDQEILAAAIKRVHEGGIYFLPDVAERLASLSIQGDASPQSKLDARELEIFVLMANGSTNAEIAEKLGVSTKTISNSSQAIKEKLGVHRSADITKLAVKHSLVEP